MTSRASPQTILETLAAENLKLNQDLTPVLHKPTVSPQGRQGRNEISNILSKADEVNLAASMIYDEEFNSEMTNVPVKPLVIDTD